MSKTCPDCLRPFEAYHGNVRRCVGCQHIAQVQREKEKTHKRKSPLRSQQGNWITEHYLPHQGRIIYRADFLLHLPAMRAELARQVGKDISSTRYDASDPLEIPTLHAANRPAHTGRPRGT